MNSGPEENKPKLNASTPLQQYREIMLALAERPADRPAPSADAKLSADDAQRFDRLISAYAALLPVLELPSMTKSPILLL